MLSLVGRTNPFPVRQDSPFEKESIYLTELNGGLNLNGDEEQSLYLRLMNVFPIEIQIKGSL